MASSFDRWEKDPFFYAAEEVQESADRMETTYRTWIHAQKDTSGAWKIDELQRDLQTSLGTTKWQLEEFEKAVQSSYSRGSNDETKCRHLQFIIAIEDQISNIEESLRESAISEGKPKLSWMQLDEGERNELAWFLSAPPRPGDNKDSEIPQEMEMDTVSDSLNNPSHSIDLGSSGDKVEKSHGHRRTASASPNIGEWKIVFADSGSQQNPSKRQPPLPPRKTPSYSSFLNSLESPFKSKWSTKSARKWKAVDCQHETDLELLHSQMTTDDQACCIKCKSCSGNGCCDKNLHGWSGTVQRQLQRSQYLVKYSRPLKLAFSIILFICIFVLIVDRAVAYIEAAILIRRQTIEF